MDGSRADDSNSAPDAARMYNQIYPVEFPAAPAARRTCGRRGRAGAHAVKLEGGIEVLPQVEKLANSGIPVMAHIGFTPQMEHQLGGYRVQGRGDDAQRLIDSAKAFEAAGAFAILIEMVPGDVGRAITEAVSIPTVGIGAGNQCDAQVLVWQDMAGLRTGRMPRFVKQYADLRSVLHTAARDFALEVGAGTFPGAEHTF